MSTIVYPKPDTPTKLVLKGNGTSGTWFVDETTDIYMGYGNFGDIAIDKRSDKWFISQASISHLNDAYIYKKKTYPQEKVTITSGIIKNNNIKDLLEGPVCQGGFARLA